MQITSAEILAFWFSENIKKQWFSATPELDREICRQFESLWSEASKGRLDDWMSSAEGCLALAITLDQFPLNMFRGESKSFSTEALAITITRHAIEHGFDKQLPKEQVAFLYMPLMHSEDLDDQELSVTCFESTALANNARFARHHRGIVERFGRFPHRNAILGRESTQEEIDYLNSKEAFTG